MYLLIKADHLPVPQGPTWTMWRGQGEKRIPMAQQECCCSQGPTGCKSYTELLLEVLKDEAEARGKNGTHRTGRPIRAITMFSLSKRTRFKVRPHPWNIGVSAVWEQGPPTPGCRQPERSGGSCLVQAEPEHRRPRHYLTGRERWAPEASLDLDMYSQGQPP